MFAVFSIFRLESEIRDDSVELANEFVASVAAEHLIEPTGVWFGVFGCNNFDNVALMKFCFQIDHFAIYFCASTRCANFAMKTIGEIERHGAFG